MFENTQLTLQTATADIELYSINALLNMNFCIPEYQRGYRWTEQQVRDLLDDILEFMNKEPQGKEFYCLQPLVVKKKPQDTFHKIKNEAQCLEDVINLLKGSWEVIDGQQRLTTIKILLTYLGGGKSYTIEYDTRSKSQFFLDNISACQNYADNIDFFHMHQAWITIYNWFNDKSDEQKKHFKETLLTQVKFIWYETNARDQIKVFTRLNIGKIPLTDAELIKALFLNRSNFAGTANEAAICLEQQEIAAEWDRIEYALQDDAFWLFINNDVNWNITKPTRIDFILDLIQTFDKFDLKEQWKNRYNKSDEDWNKCIGTDEHKTFRYFYEYFKIHKSDIQNNSKEYHLRDAIWRKIKDHFQIFEECFNDLKLYHYVGFLIAEGFNINDVVENWHSDKQTFRDYIRDKVQEKIGAVDLAQEYEISGKPKQKCRPLLLLFNIQTVINQNNELTQCKKYGLGTSYKFPFHLFKKEGKKENGKGWEIEHIASNAGDDLDDIDKQKIYLHSISSSLPEGELKKSVYDFLKSDKPQNFYGLYEKTLSALNRDMIDEKCKNYIWNFALLDSTTNEEYQNATFPIKRICILAKDNGKKAMVAWNKKKLKPEVKYDNGIAFVPPCTRAVFTKAYTDIFTALNAWTAEDAQNYLWNIYSTLSDAGFLKKIKTTTECGKEIDIGKDDYIRRYTAIIKKESN